MEQIKLRNRILESQRSIQELVGTDKTTLSGTTATVDSESGEECDEDDIECLTEGKDFIR